MTDLGSRGEFRAEVHGAISRFLDDVASVGTWWSAAERLAIAAVSRAARGGWDPPDTDLPIAAIEAASLLAADPARTTERWVESVVARIGEQRYVELVGVNARTMAVDTLHRLAGLDLPTFPEPGEGEPARTEVDGLRRSRTWVSMGRFVAPPLVLAAVPDEVAAQNDLSDVLYMSGDEMADEDFRRRDLHRTQIELVAATTSHVNECFY